MHKKLDPVLSWFFLWFVPLIWKRGDDIKLIAVARSIGVENTNMFGKLFSFYGVSDDSIDIIRLKNCLKKLKYSN